MGRLQDLRKALQSDDASAKTNTVRRSVYEQVNATPAMQESKPVIAKTEIKDEAPAVTESQPISSLLEYYIRVTGSFARLNGDMLTQNLLVVANGLPEDVRVISLESVMWLAGNFGKLTAAMILNHQDARQLHQISFYTRHCFDKRAGVSFSYAEVGHCVTHLPKPFQSFPLHCYSYSYS